MKIALIFAGDQCSAPYRSERFLQALKNSGFEPVAIMIDHNAGATVSSGERAYRCPPGGLNAILPHEAPRLIQTFGSVSRLASVWRAAARTRAPLVHFVSSNGPVGRDSADPGLAGNRSRRRLLASWSAKRASRHVRGVIGSNRADVGQHIQQGFFPRAEFSMIAPPPVALPEEKDAGPLAAPVSTSVPILGVYDPDGTSLAFLFHAVELTGHPDLFRVHVAPARLQTLAFSAPANVSFVEAADLPAFVRSIDVLVLPSGEDRMTAGVVGALRARKIVIVPEGGTAAELIEYGRHGILYAAGSAYHLAMALNVTAQSWQDRPFDFHGVDRLIAKSAPEDVANTFAAAYRRLAA